ncbi:MAG: metalloregulator ArsR/SmtB family transcription factor [archaeon]
MKTEHAPHKCMEVLGNKLRAEIICLLQDKPQTVQDICTKLGREQSLVSHSLKQLRECSFVDYRKDGKTSIYYLKSDIFTKNKNKPIFEVFEEHAAKYCKHKAHN